MVWSSIAFPIDWPAPPLRQIHSALPRSSDPWGRVRRSGPNGDIPCAQIELPHVVGLAHRLSPTSLNTGVKLLAQFIAWGTEYPSYRTSGVTARRSVPANILPGLCRQPWPFFRPPFEPMEMSHVYRKPSWIECEPVGDEAVLLNTKTLQTHLLNDLGAALWDAMDEFPTAEGLAALLAEARPEAPPAEHLQTVRAFLDQLTEPGYLTLEAPASQEA